jgi:flagellar protein FlaJ
MKITKIQLIGLLLSVSVVAINFIIFFNQDIKVFYFIDIIAGIIAVSPFIIEFLFETERQKSIEEKFLEFSRDLVENVKSGTSIGKSIINLKTRNYGPLSSHVEKLANQISLGIPLTQAMETFAKDTKNKIISRSITLISEAERSGGQIETILEAVTKSVNQIENLQKERKTASSNMVVQGYIIFFVFIVIMLILEFKILPMLANAGLDAGGIDQGIKKITPEEFAFPLFLLITIQSIFTGLVIGKISEGSIKRGIKHSAILLAITLLIVTGARAFIQI